MRELILERVLESLGGIDIALLGLGAIALNLLEIRSRRNSEEIIRVRLGVDTSEEAREVFWRRASHLYPYLKVTGDHEELWRGEHELVVEAASVEAVRALAKPILESGKHFLILSLGALIGWDELEDLRARKLLSRLWVSGGAIGPLALHEFLKLLAPKNLELRTFKPPKALGLERSERVMLFSDDIEGAIKAFPKNVNVVAFLRTYFPDKRIGYQLWADPSLTRNRHVLRVGYDSGELEFHVSSDPTPQNPRTSLITAFSLYYDLLLIGVALKSGSGGMRDA